MRCPYCGGETDANRPFCRHCGKRIDSIQVEPVPTGQTGGERSPYGQGRGNSPAPYPGRGRESRSRGDILMIVIGVILALAAVGIAVFILTHMIGDGTVGRRKESTVTAESKKTESKKTESRTAANGGAESQEAGTEAVAPSGDVTAEPTAAPTEILRRWYMTVIRSHPGSTEQRATGPVSSFGSLLTPPVSGRSVLSSAIGGLLICTVRTAGPAGCV